MTAVSSHVVLFADRVVDHGLFFTRELRRDNILGRKLLQQGSSPGTIVLVPRDRQRAIKIALVVKTDDAFLNWMESLPDLDAQERNASHEEIVGGTENFSMREERSAEFERQRQFAKQLNIAACIVAAWGWFYPHPYNLVITLLILLPWLALFVIARSPGFYRISKPRNDAHLSLDAVLVTPPLILALRVISDMHPLEWKPVLGVSLVVGVVMWALAAKSDPVLRTRWVHMALIGIMSAAYGYGAGMEINALLDSSQPAIYRAAVVHKHISSGGRHTNYDLTLKAWGPVDQAEQLSVPYALYRSVSVGELVCIHLRLGALKIAWYTVQACEK